MASAQQLIGLVKSHAEGDKDRFYDLAMQLAAAEAQKGHKRLAEQLRDWAEAGQSPPLQSRTEPTPIAAPRGNLADVLNASYPTARLNDVILGQDLKYELTQLVIESGEFDLQSVLVRVRVDLAAQGRLHRGHGLARLFAFDQAIAFDEVQSFAVRCAENIDHRQRPGFDADRVHHKRIAFEVSD
jgi:hypothetical protein